jgi:hypothetical protein
LEAQLAAAPVERRHHDQDCVILLNRVVEAADTGEAPERSAAADTTQAVSESSSAPDRQGLVLITLILVAAVANLNLAVANVALPDIGKAFNASQTALDLVAVGYSLGVAASVLYLGALGDRYGRKLMLVLGTAIAIPAAIVAATASSVGILIGARILGGLAAGMAFPTTLALITALWSGPGARARSHCGRASAVRSRRSARCYRERCSSTMPGARCSCSPCRSR